MEGDVEWQGLDKGKIWLVIKIKDFYLEKRKKKKTENFFKLYILKRIF